MSDVASQTSPRKRIHPQKHVITTEHPNGNQTGNKQVPILSCSNSCPNEIQESVKHTVTTRNGDTTILSLTKSTPAIEERLVRDEQTNQLHLPLTSTVVLKRNQEMLYVPLEYENILTVDALENSGANFSAIPQSDIDTKKNRNPRIISAKSTTL